MFTGIVVATCPVRGIQGRADGSRLKVDLSALGELPVVSASVCVQGTCLTVADLEGPVASFDVVRETLTRTTLGDLRAGREVNVEPSLKAGDEIGGHYVTGHVDGIAILSEVERKQDSMEIRIRPPRELSRFIAEKGSVTLDGVSLTVAGLTSDGFRIAIVPHTARVTTFRDARPGQRLNLEVDILARYVARWLEMGPG